MGRVSIRWKMTGLIFFLLGLSLFILGIFLVKEFIQAKENEMKERAMLTARTVAELPGVSEHISQDEAGSETLASIVERIRMINNADYITVLNMDRVRLTHPVKSMVGTVSEGTDEGPAFAEHSYTSKAKGEIGTVIRAFTPVMNKDHEQVGVVIVGYKIPSFFETLLSLKKQIFWTGGLALFFGGWGAWLLARHIKKQMFQLEPHEIARLLVERTEAFNAMHEGIVAIDMEETITIFNNKAKEMLGIEGDVVGKKIRDVLPDTRLPEIIELEKPIYNQDLQIRNLAIVSNRIPIKVNNQTVGAIAIFQDRTQVKKLAEELTGVKAFVNALRVQNHEHMNKLHTIAGLIQLGNNEKALVYVFEVTEEQEELIRFLSKNIMDDSLTGLLLSKVSRGKELGIHVTIDRHSSLKQFPPFMDHHDFVLILGNLIENAFDSFKNIMNDDKEVYVRIQQNEKILCILVEDNGSGIPEHVQPFIFEQGYSSKSETGRGIGLFLVKQAVEKGKGEIIIDSKEGKGTSFSITFPMDAEQEGVEG
jgi:two-component system, CitB family, sensor histidine kinase DctS